METTCPNCGKTVTRAWDTRTVRRDENGKLTHGAWILAEEPGTWFRLETQSHRDAPAGHYPLDVRRLTVVDTPGKGTHKRHADCIRTGLPTPAQVIADVMKRKALHEEGRFDWEPKE